MHYDPLSDRINDRRDHELELLRAECNRVAGERDYLAQKVKALELIREQQRKVIDRLRFNLRRRHDLDHKALLEKLAG